MPYVQVDNFKFGLDRRRPRVAGSPGTLWNLVDANISRGGDVQQRKAFVPTYMLPVGTFGMATIATQLFVFGSDDLAASMPTGVQYQRLQSPASANMTAVLGLVVFNRQLYVIAAFDDGSILHFYNGVRVVDWDVIADANTDVVGLTEYLTARLASVSGVYLSSAGNQVILQAKAPGTGFTVSASATGTGSITLATPQPNVVAVAEARATAALQVTGGADTPTNALTSLTVGSVELLANPVKWVATNEATAILIQQAITANAAVSGYDAAVSGSTVTIQAAPGTGATPNGLAIAFAAQADMAVTAGAALAGGVTAVAAQAQITTATLGGTFATTDQYTITVNGTAIVATGRAAATGQSVFVFKGRVYSPSKSLARYCMLNTPLVWDPARTTDPVSGDDISTTNDSGFIDISTDNAGQEDLTAIAEFSGNVLFFSQNFVRCWTLDADPTKNVYVNTVENSGTVSPRSVQTYGNTDTFYLDSTGVRSMRPRVATDIASVADVGTALDSYIQDFENTVTPYDVSQGVSSVEPIDGRYMLAIADTMFVLSYFPTPGISAWSVYKPGFVATAFAKISKRLLARDTSTIYTYGGLDGQTYAATGVALVETPFMSASTPAEVKDLTGFDLACAGTWKVQVLEDPNNETLMSLGGIVNGTTYNGAAQSVPGRTSLFALRLTCLVGGDVTLSAASVHYEKAEEAS